jgi:hypothetical protein
MCEPFLGAHVAGWSAFALDVILRRHAKDYTRAMSPVQQREMEAVRRAIHTAALLWRAQLRKRRQQKSHQNPGVMNSPRRRRRSISASNGCVSSQFAGPLMVWPARLAVPLDRTAVVIYRDNDRRSAA